MPKAVVYYTTGCGPEVPFPDSGSTNNADGVAVGPHMLTARMVYAAGTLVLAVVAFWGACQLPKRRLAWPAAVLSGLVFAVAGLVLTWSLALASGDRSPRSLDLGGGVTYERIALHEPHRQVLHIATVDLDNPCIGLTTTRPGPGGAVAAETGTEFVERTGVILSINVAFFRGLNEFPPGRTTRSGDRLIAIGPVVIDGEWLGDVQGGGKRGLALTDGRLSASRLPSNADFAVRGKFRLVLDGENVAPESKAYPRVVAGVDIDTNRLVLLVSDGKQPGYAEGSTYQQTADLLIELGVDEALEFDGGGSATMAGMVDGKVELLNRPSHQQLPGRQRPVATHLGITLDSGCSEDSNG